ncbi:TRAP transporter small permease [Deltaproteobacteria bacterium OttesenSCG-928-M10]|nr:TRAP transporter small permease [Deltaproteobacteria bacterium OttesenSCG-928-M10]
MEGVHMAKRGIMFYVDWVEEKFLVYTFFLTIILISAQIFMRVVINSSLAWSEELSRYLFIWQCWLGVSFAERKAGQIQIVFLKEVISDAKKRYVDIFATIVTMGTAIALIYLGVELCLKIMGGNVKSTAMRIPLYWIYASMPISCFLFTVRSAFKLNRLVREKEGC